MVRLRLKSDIPTTYEPDLCLKFTSKTLLMVPKYQLITKGDPAFAVHAPHLSNSLPDDLLKVSFFRAMKH